jgi:hypothetical protein
MRVRRCGHAASTRSSPDPKNPAGRTQGRTCVPPIDYTDGRTTVTEPSGLQELISEAMTVAKRCLTTDSADDCDALDQLIHQIDGLARETLQSRLAADLERIARRLETGARPTREEESLIELVVIGTASRHVDTEYHVPQWKAELRRLLDELTDGANEPIDSDGLLKIRALCRNATDVLPELRHWMVDRERVARFREAAAEADPERSVALARYIRTILQADNR